MKRLFDVTSSLIGLTLLVPVFIVTGCAIKLDSEGPVFFRQKRVGLNNQLFEIYKFRSMVQHTPDVETAKLGKDISYITTVGRVIRKTSIDELPQLINVLKGEMSLVGPRPALHNQYELIEDRSKENIHLSKPGITGLAQVMGRDTISDKEKIIFDRYYVENQTFLFDMWILYKTVRNVIKSEGISH